MVPTFDSLELKGGHRRGEVVTGLGHWLVPCRGRAASGLAGSMSRPMYSPSLVSPYKLAQATSTLAQFPLRTSPWITLLHRTWFCPTRRQQCY